MRKLISTCLVLLAFTATLIAPSAASASDCALKWGSTAKTASGLTAAPLVNVRAGQHHCFDRIVITLAAGQVKGYTVKYVSAVRREGSGTAMSLRGDADLLLRINAPAYDMDGNATYTPADRRNVVNVSGYRTLRQVAWGGSFEGYTTLGVGVRARLPFRVFKAAGPGEGSRLIVDVAHRW